MNNLIVTQGKTTSSFDFHEKINELRESCGESRVRHNDFLVRISDEIEDLGAYETFVHPQNNQPIKFYNLNHDQMLLVGMRESKSVRRKVLEWLKNIGQFQIPQTYGDALQLCADQAKQLELNAPKVAFVESLVERDNLMTATQVGQKHKLSAIKLNRILTELKVYNGAVKRCKVFQQWFIDKGYGEMKKTELGYDQPLFTNAGEIWINEKLINEGVV